MKRFIFLAITAICVLGCSPKVEYNYLDVEYDSTTNSFHLKDSGNTEIVKPFVIVGEIIDGYNVSREVLFSTSNKPGIINTYFDEKLVLETKIISSPRRIEHTYLSNYPNKKFEHPYIQTEILEDGVKRIFYKYYPSKETFLEEVFDSKGTLVKTFKWKDNVRIEPMTEKFTVEKIETGFIDSYRLNPAVKIVFRNTSGKKETHSIEVTYKFINKDEIIDEGFKYIDCSAGWDVGLTKTIIIKEYKYSYLCETSGIKAVICFEKDQSVIFDGPIKARYVIW